MADRRRVLIVDDNPTMLQAVMRMLESDFEIVAALEDETAVTSRAREEKPDIVVLDIAMGEMNGFEIARQLKLDGSEAKIVFLTVHEELEFIRAAFDAGASGYVFKSRMNTDLRIAINTVEAGRVFIPEPPILQYSSKDEFS